MDETADLGALAKAAKALHRSFVRAALSWGIDPAFATHNPVFVRDGFLNYISHESAREEAFDFLRQTGVLEEGFNGAHRLPVPLDQIDRSADAAFENGLGTEQIVERLLGLLHYCFGSLGTCFGTYPDIQMSANPQSTSLDFPNEAEELESVMRNLQILGYVESTRPDDAAPHYQWTPEALPILKRLYMVPSDT